MVFGIAAGPVSPGDKVFKERCFKKDHDCKCRVWNEKQALYPFASTSACNAVNAAEMDGMSLAALGRMRAGKAFYISFLLCRRLTVIRLWIILHVLTVPLSARRGNENLWGDGGGPTVYLWETLTKQEQQECLKKIQTANNWSV